MKASVFLGKQDIQIMDFELANLQPDEVLIDIKYCGVCGTDIHIYNGHEGSADVTAPIILGHECSGYVAQIGTEVSGLAVGDAVTVNPNDMCGKCYFCNSGRSAFCENHLAIGTIAHGAFAEQIKVHAKQVHKTEGISMQNAAMIEPLSCCYNVFEVLETKLGDTYLIVGGGPIGLMMLQLANIAGASRVIVADIVAQKREKALSLGASYAFDPNVEDLEQILAQEGIKNLDKIIECVGLKTTQEYCLKYIGKGTEVMFFGLGDPATTLEINPFELFRKQATIKSSFINPDTFEKTLELVKGNKIELSSLIADIVPPEDLPDVLQNNSRRDKGKILVEFS